MLPVGKGACWVSTETEAAAIAGELAQVVAAIGRAQEEALGAAEAARTTTMRAAAAGYAAIAGQLDAIRKQIHTIHGILDSAATTAKEAGGTVREVTDRMNPTEVASRLSATTAKIDTMRGTLYSAAQQLATTSGNVSQALHGGQPGPMLQRLDLVRQLAAIANQRGGAVKQSIQSALGRVGQIGGSGN
jgi:hypothetical protein